MNLELQRAYDRCCESHGAYNSDIYKHIPKLREYAEKCETVTEFGVRWVVSTWAFIAAKPKKLRCYDIIKDIEVDRAQRVAIENGVDFTFVLGSTLEVDIEETDLLFIDTLHTYKQLNGELARHADKVKRFILLHDTIVYARHGMGPEHGGDTEPKGLQDALDEFLAQHKEWRVAAEYKYNNGLTALERVVL